MIAKTHPVAVRLEGAAFETLKYLSATTRQPYAGVEYCVLVALQLYSPANSQFEG